MLKAAPGTCAVRRMSVNGQTSLELDGLTEEQAIEKMRILNAKRTDSFDDLFSVITEFGLGTGPRVIDPQFALAQYQYQLRLKNG